MTLRARLALGLLAVVLLLVVPLVVALAALQDAERSATALREQTVAGTLLVGRIRETTQQLREADNAVLFIYEDSSLAAESLEAQQRAARELAARGDTARAYGLADLANTMRASAATITTFGHVEAAAAVDRERDVADRTSTDKIIPAIEAVERVLARTERELATEARQTAERTSEDARRAQDLAALLFGVAAFAVLAIAYWLTWSISRPVKDLERGMAAVAGGKFGHRLELEHDRRDEFGRLATSFRSMADQLAELDKLKAEFVSVASHELKTPINVILGYLKLLEEGLYGPLSERQLDIVRTLEGQGHSLARLTQHLLDVSRFEAGAGRLEMRPVSLQAFLTQVGETHAVLASQRDVTFVVTAAPGLPEVVTWDADRMHEVASNLLSNAFKFTEAGGRVEFAVSPAPDGVSVEVRDTGAGIPAEQVPHVFDKFYQADNQTAASAKGTGLGLAITKEIVEAHGGSIAVSSRRGEGTTFSIVLPLAAAASAPEAAPAALAPADQPVDEGTAAVGAV